MLSQTEIEQIKNAAQETYDLTSSPVFGISAKQINDLQKERITAFITGATIFSIKEKEKAKMLADALKLLMDDIRRKPNDTRYATCMDKAQQALDNYNKQ